MVPHRIVDLSHPIMTGPPVYPGDPEVELRPAATVAAQGYNVLHLTMGSQSGTHVDAPYHLIDDGARVDAMDLARFLGPGLVLDVRGIGARAPITAELLAAAAPALRPGLIVLVHTGWSRHWGSAAYLDHPYLDASAAQLLLDGGVRTVGIDAASVDETTTSYPHPTGLAVHQLLLAAGVPIVENLTALDRIQDPEPLISVLPLRLAGADGAPVRAVAFSLTDPS